MGFDLRHVSPIVWWVLGGLVVLVIIARIRGYSVRDLIPRVKSPLPPPGPPLPRQLGSRPPSVEAAIKMRRAIVDEQLDAEADDLAREHRDAIRLANQRFVNRATGTVQQQLPFDTPGETGSGSGAP